MILDREEKGKMKERRKRENSRKRRKEKKEEKRTKKMWFCEPAVSSSRSGWADINAQPTHPLCQLVRRMMIKNTAQHTLSGQWVRE